MTACHTLTPKQESFAQSYVETGNASEAYRSSYNARDMKEQTIWRKAKEVIDNGKVTARIAELQERAQKRHDITVDKLTDMAVKAYDMAMAEKAPSAAISAVQALGKLHGLIVEKTKNEHTGANGAPLVPTINVTITRNGPPIDASKASTT